MDKIRGFEKISISQNLDVSWLERKTGFEPAALGLGSRCSTTELFPPTEYYYKAAIRFCQSVALKLI